MLALERILSEGALHVCPIACSLNALGNFISSLQTATAVRACGREGRRQGRLYHCTAGDANASPRVPSYIYQSSAYQRTFVSAIPWRGRRTQGRRSCCAGSRAFGQASAIVGDDGRSPGRALRLEIDVAVQHPERLGLLCSIVDSTLRLPCLHKKRPSESYMHSLPHALP
jgi:hypothetical protein